MNGSGGLVHSSARHYGVTGCFSHWAQLHGGFGQMLRRDDEV